MQQLNAVCFERAIRALDTLLSIYIMNSWLHVLLHACTNATIHPHNNCYIHSILLLYLLVVLFYLCVHALNLYRSACIKSVS